MILLWKIIIYGVILMKKVLFILLTEVIIKEAGPTIDLDSLPNLANTDYSPNSLSNGNESSDRLSAGKYRAKLGGTIRTVQNGTYSAIANGYSYFEVK